MSQHINETLAYATMEIISAVLMKENTVNYPDIANCSQRRLHRSRVPYRRHPPGSPVHTLHVQHDPHPRLEWSLRRGAASVHTTSRICAAGNSWIERSNQYTSIIWFSFVAAASVGSRIYLRFREFMIVTRVPKAYFVANFFSSTLSARHHETSLANGGNKTKKRKRACTWDMFSRYKNPRYFIGRD